MLDALHAALGPAGCLTKADVPAGTAMDASRTGRTPPLALLRPASVAQVAQALAICQAQGLTVVPQGGLTGLAGWRAARSRWAERWRCRLTGSTGSRPSIRMR